MLVSTVKMATVLEECFIEEQRSLLCFLWVGLRVKDIHKEIFLLRVRRVSLVRWFYLSGKYFADEKKVEAKM
jgi:hypothetical protein